VEHKRDIIDRRRVVRTSVGDTVEADFARIAHGDGDHLYTIAGGSPSRIGRISCAFGRQKEQLRVRIFEVKEEFLFFVGRIQRGRRAGHRRGEKRHDRGKSIRQRHADTIATADAAGRERLGHVLDLRPQLRVRDTNVLIWQHNRGAAGRSRCEEFQKS
jgi:hypothetical protein